MSEPKPQSRRIYLDFNASCPPAHGVADAVAKALTQGGNPSSPHREGRAARAILEEGRQAVASVLGAEPLDLVFCSGGTEANHLGLAGLARAWRNQDASRCGLLLPSTVHPSLLAVGQALVREGFALREVPVDAYGRMRLDLLEDLLADETVAVLGFSLVGHELGSLESVSELVEGVRARGTALFCDAVQGFAKLPLDLGLLGVDGLSISGHKIGGPQGIGALWLAPGPDIGPLFGGGKQEGSRRPGTQATALVAGLSAALRSLDSTLANRARLEPLWRELRSGLTALGAHLHSDSDAARTLSSTISGRFEGVPGDVLVASLDLAGVAISTGAACSSGMMTPSVGLQAMGLSATQALEAFRISMGPATHREHVQVLLELLPNIIERAKRFS